jgi:hypothetical protein
MSGRPGRKTSLPYGPLPNGRWRTSRRGKDQLVEAFILQKVIDEATYKDQLGKLNEAMALAEIDQHDQRAMS